MSSVKQMDKKRSPTNNQTKRPARVESRQTKLQQEKGSKTVKPKEPNKKVLPARAKSSIVVSDRKKNTKVDEVYEKLFVDQTDKVSTDLYKDPNDEKEESDSETVTDSVSSSGDSRATDHDLHNLQINTSPNISEKINQDSKYLKVHPKPPSTPSSISSEGFDDQDSGESKEVDIFNGALNGIVRSVGSDGETFHSDENTEREAKESLDLTVLQMKMRIEKLEDELREVAALEISLYSAVQEHGRSLHTVHIPAHRLSKLYIHMGKNFSQEKSASIGRNIVSGLVMISSSCGNDVPRLTFWWSNVIVLREIISQAFESQETTFISELEKVESGIFSQIVESIWQQTLMPYMLKNEKTEKLLEPISDGQQQSNFSIDLWLNAFGGAFNRICPVRAGGNECGCLPVLAKMVMQQCAARLDVSMFNCILRKSEHEVQTDSVSDPITESRVLPIPAEDLSFGSGAQLKKAVGNWSKFITDKLSLGTDQAANEDNARIGEQKWFNLLNSLSHLLMVPKDMLMDKSIRAEVCPSISLSLLKQVLSSFTSDEFCPDPVPDTVLEAVKTELINESRLSEDNSSSFPCAAPTIIYLPPSSIDVGKQVYEEVKELDSSTTFMTEKQPAANGNASSVSANIRFKLLHEVWSS
uniref:uncharacterized protein LOC122594118 n=1 Tax=Erigeron canadensis TaxID=72917 RepID=UPI001CB9C74A|nr:uncharacterized protein LOC122594118 [Erigeron canadensis]XP_043622530.1 uncharacterized protein LOC122594118 [Erigeron canadensis]